LTSLFSRKAFAIGPRRFAFAVGAEYATDVRETPREALIIFYGKLSVYLRALERPLPGQWGDWIG
jgi:hypothetical protein